MSTASTSSTAISGAFGSVVQAAGVVLLRAGAHQDEVLLIHRPHRRDWSLPKGKLEPGEHPAVAAVRECDEETGFSVVLGAPLQRLSYIALGRPKMVDYWRASIRQDEGFIPHDEVDELQWVPVDEARAQLTYPHDADVVEQAAEIPLTHPLVILRHASAVKRSDFKGKVDAERPLSGRGRSQAKRLIPLLDAYGLSEIITSDATRCVQTVRKFAKSIDAMVTRDHALSEEGHQQDPAQAAQCIAELVHRPVPTVVCTHRPLLPTVLDAVATALGAATDDPAWDPRLRPGGCLVVHRSFGADGTARLQALERHEVPD